MPALFLLLSIFLFSCNDDSPSSSSTSDVIIPKLYVCDQVNDKVIVLDASTIDLDEIYSIDINFTDDSEEIEMPHHVTIDEQNGYWFVATTEAGYIGMYDLSSDTLIHDVYVGGDGAMPALLTADKSNKILYVSKSSMPMSTLNEIDVLSYDMDSLVVEESITLSETIDDFPKPHAISLDVNTSMGSSLITASYENDWIARVTDYSGYVSSSSTLTRIGLDVDVDGPNTSNKYKPIAAAQKDDFIFLSCVGDSLDVKSQVQLWDLSELQQGPKGLLEFSINSRLWHITPSPVDNNVYVVLKGYSNVPSSSGLASFGYDSLGNLTLNWQKMDSSFDELHGVAVSADGSRLYVSSKGDGSIHVFNSSGELLNSISNAGGATKDLTGIALVQVP